MPQWNNASSPSPVELSWSDFNFIASPQEGERKRARAQSYEIEIVVEGETESILVRHFPYCFVDV